MIFLEPSAVLRISFCYNYDKDVCNPDEEGAEIQLTIKDDIATYVLPDGKTIELGNCRQRAPDLLFRPELIGTEYPGIHQCIYNAIEACDTDLRKNLYSNIVVSGGSTMFNGFGDRLLGEMRKLAPKDVKVRIVAPQERILGTWVGGSILASLDAFRKIWVTKKEYEDNPSIVFRKSF
uniref:Actin n=1 Tax=Panagrolaimus sp. JU765 TaxID=591449 RepID=A0AC34QWU3_9BILA